MGRTGTPMTPWPWKRTQAMSEFQSQDSQPPKSFSDGGHMRLPLPKEEPDDSTAAFTAALGALATPARILLLRAIRTPKTVTEIKLKLPGEAEGHDRVLARQTVKQHLDRLVEVGVVHAREAERTHGRTLEYVVNHQVLYSLSEEFRSLAKLRPTDLPPSMTRTAFGPKNAAQRGRPCLILVKGLDEGRIYDLAPPPKGPAEWLIGRRRGLSISLDFDEFVSSENSRIRWDGQRHSIEDLALSRNGTWVNFRQLPKGSPTQLERGDIVGVGRSTLVFQA